jgi:hypothetical protein
MTRLNHSLNLSKSSLNLSRKTVQKGSLDSLAAVLRPIKFDIAFRLLEAQFREYRAVGLCWIRPLGRADTSLVLDDKAPRSQLKQKGAFEGKSLKIFGNAETIEQTFQRARISDRNATTS